VYFENLLSCYFVDCLFAATRVDPRNNTKEKADKVVLEAFTGNKLIKSERGTSSPTRCHTRKDFDQVAVKHFGVIRHRQLMNLNSS